MADKVKCRGCNRRQAEIDALTARVEEQATHISELRELASLRSAPKPPHLEDTFRDAVKNESEVSSEQAIPVNRLMEKFHELHGANSCEIVMGEEVTSAD